MTGKIKSHCRCLESPSAVVAGHPSSTQRQGQGTVRTPDSHSWCTAQAVGSREEEKCPAHPSHPPATPLFWKPELTQMQNQQSEKSRAL